VSTYHEGDPLNKERRFLPLRLDDAPIKGSLTRFRSLNFPVRPGKHPAMNTATISTKGQLVIPTRFRKALHLQAGDKVSLTLEGDRLLLEREQPRRARLVDKNGRKVLVAPPGAPPMTPEVVKSLLADFP